MTEDFGTVRGDFRIEERDIQVMLALEKWGLLGLGQLDGLMFRKGVGAEERTRLFFNEIERKDYWLGAYKRLRRLEVGGLIRAQDYLNQRKVFFLTDRGHGVLKELGRARLRRNLRGLSEFWARHELAVAAVGLVVSEVLGLPVSSERERYQLGGFDPKALRKGEVVMPDLLIPIRGQIRALEVELVPKTRERYAKLWTRYYHKLPEGGAVLYLTGWPNGDEWMIQLARRLRAHFLYCAPLSKFRESLGRRAFVRQNEAGGIDLLSLKRPEQESPRENERSLADVPGALPRAEPVGRHAEVVRPYPG